MEMYTDATKQTLDESRDIYQLMVPFFDPSSSRSIFQQTSFQKQNDSMERLERARDVMEYLVTAYPQPIREDITYQTEEIIGSCSFGQIACGPKNFTPIYDPIYGRCFTFNTTLTSERAGPHYGRNVFLRKDLA